PKLVASGKSGRFLSGREPYGREQLQGRDADGISLKRAMHRHSIAQMPRRLGLGFEIEKLPRRIVIQHEFRPANLIRTLCRFGKSFVDGTTAVDDDARPRSLSFYGILSRQCKTQGKKDCQWGDQGVLRHVLLQLPAQHIEYRDKDSTRYSLELLEQFLLA